MPQLDTYDVVSIVGIPVYVVFLVCAIYLCIKHGFSKSSGWRFLMVLAIARIISFGMRLGLMNDPTNKSLWIGWLTVTNLGLGPLILLLLGLLSRVFESINRQGHVVLKPLYQRLIEVVVLVALILTIVGGTSSTYSLQDGTIKIDYVALTRVGVGLMVAAAGLLCLETFIAFRYQGFVAQGEHRILLGVIASIPFVIVRVAYSCLLVFAGIHSDVWMYLFMGILPEMIVVFTVEVLGFTLDKGPTEIKGEGPEQQGQQQDR